MRGCDLQGREPALAATLYGPCVVEAQLAGVGIRIEERTEFPFSGVVELTVEPESPVRFCLWLRKPGVVARTRIECPGAEITRAGCVLAGTQTLEEWRYSCNSL